MLQNAVCSYEKLEVCSGALITYMRLEGGRGDYQASGWLSKDNSFGLHSGLELILTRAGSQNWLTGLQLLMREVKMLTTTHADLVGSMFFGGWWRVRPAGRVGAQASRVLSECECPQITHLAWRRKRSVTPSSGFHINNLLPQCSTLPLRSFV